MSPSSCCRPQSPATAWRDAVEEILMILPPSRSLERFAHVMPEKAADLFGTVGRHSSNSYCFTLRINPTPKVISPAARTTAPT